jgi:three-Cys-motif partner protein
VPAPVPTLWEMAPHTLAKHRILRRYLGAWFPIMNRESRVVYLDGFAGPGKYTGGEPGSPIIALATAKMHPARLSAELVFLFIEQRRDRADYLKKEIEALDCPNSFRKEVRCGDFEPTLTALLDEIDQSKNRLAPTFAMIDPFGFEGIPLTLMKRLLANPKCEVFVSFMASYMNRFLDHPNDGVRAHIREVFGGDEPFAVVNAKGDRVAQLADIYRQKLRKIVRFVRAFELRDLQNKILYYLFFASDNRVGHLKMKEAMWTVDRLGEFRFSDTTNPNQEVLYGRSYEDLLKADLLQRFPKMSGVTVGAVERYVADDTAFLPTQIRTILKVLEAEKRVHVAEQKADGSKRKKGTFPKGAILSFQ